MAETARKPHPLSWIAMCAGIGIGTAASIGARPQLGWLGSIGVGMIVSVAVGLLGLFIVRKLVKPKA